MTPLSPRLPSGQTTTARSCWQSCRNPPRFPPATPPRASMCRCWQATIRALPSPASARASSSLPRRPSPSRQAPRSAWRRTDERRQICAQTAAKAASAAVSGAAGAQRDSGRACHRVRGQAAPRDASFNYAVCRRSLEGAEHGELRAGLGVPTCKPADHRDGRRDLPSDAPAEIHRCIARSARERQPLSGRLVDHRARYLRVDRVCQLYRKNHRSGRGLLPVPPPAPSLRQLYFEPRLYL